MPPRDHSRASTVIIPHASSHPMRRIDGLLPSSAAVPQSERAPTKELCDRLPYASRRSMNRSNRSTRAFLSNYCSLRAAANTISVVERCGRNPHCSSGSSSFASQRALSLVAAILRRTSPACATSEMPR